MPNNSKDTRSIRTEKALTEALFELLEKYNFDHITVNDICLKASVSRTTFYLHFEDKYELMLTCIGDVVYYPGKQLNQENLADVYEQILTNVYERKEVMKNLINYTGSWEIKQKSDALFSKIYLDYFKEIEKKGGIFDTPLEVLAAYHCGAMSELVNWWVRNDFPVAKEAVKNYLVTAMKNAEKQIHF